MPETHIKGYRPIVLLNTIFKLWTQMLTAALSDYAEQHSILSSSQLNPFCRRDLGSTVALHNNCKPLSWPLRMPG